MSVESHNSSVSIHASIQKVHTDVSVHLGCIPLKLGSTNVWVSYIPLNMIYAFEMYIWYLMIKYNSVLIYTKCQCRHWYSWPCPLSQPIPCPYLLQTLMSVWTAMEGALTSASTHSAPTSVPAPREWFSKQMGRRVFLVCCFLLNFQFSTWLCMLIGGSCNVKGSVSKYSVYIPIAVYIFHQPVEIVK